MSDEPRRRRGLSAEEKALWESVAKQAKPLKKSRRKAAVTVASPPVGEGMTEVAKPGRVEGARIQPSSPYERASKIIAIARTNTPLERRERSRIARGHHDIDARIDLHGMTQARAHRALLGFLRNAQENNCRYVLVVTGKGRTSDDAGTRGILRRMVPEWLGLADFAALVSAFQEAAIGHGGEGALYVRIRRAR